MYSVVLRLVEKSVHSLVGLLASTLTTPRHATAEAFANAHARGVSFEWLDHDLTPSVDLSLARATQLRLPSEAGCLVHATHEARLAIVINIIACSEARQHWAIDTNQVNSGLLIEVGCVVLFLNWVALVEDTKLFLDRSLFNVTLARFDCFAAIFSSQYFGLELIFHYGKALFVEVTSCAPALCLINWLDFFVSSANKVLLLLYSRDDWLLKLRVVILVHHAFRLPDLDKLWVGDGWSRLGHRLSKRQWLTKHRCHINLHDRFWSTLLHIIRVSLLLGKIVISRDSDVHVFAVNRCHFCVLLQLV